MNNVEGELRGRIVRGPTVNILIFCNHMTGSRNRWKVSFFMESDDDFIRRCPIGSIFEQHAKLRHGRSPETRSTIEAPLSVPTPLNLQNGAPDISKLVACFETLWNIWHESCQPVQGRKTDVRPSARMCARRTSDADGRGDLPDGAGAPIDRRIPCTECGPTRSW